MLRSNTKKGKKAFTFDQQLQLKLKTLKEEGTSIQSAVEKRKQIATVLQQAVNELQLQDESSIENLLPTHSRNPPPLNYQIKQINELSIEDQSSSDKFKISHKDEISSGIRLSRSQKANNHIWNLVSDQDLSEFLMHNFQNYQEQHKIMLSEFIKKAFQYFFGLRLQKSQLPKLEESLKYQLTTTEPEVLSLNALEIANKKISIKHLLIQAHIQVRLKQKMSQLQRKNKKIMSEVTAKIDSLVQRQQQIEEKNRQIAKQENVLAMKQKSMQIRQKQLLQREKETKKTIEEKCYKLSDTYISQISEKVKQAQKRLNLLEKTLKISQS